jgi:tetratricopeptide (TPR) repeat protein
VKAAIVITILLHLLMAPVLNAQTAATTQKGTASIPERSELLKRAADARQSGRRDEAIRLLRLAGERYQSVQAYLDLARLQSAGGEPAAAMDSVTKARAIAPNSEDVLSAYAQLALATKQPLPAALTLESLTRLYPTDPQYHYLLGVSLMGIGDMPSASEELAESNRLEPDRPLTLLALGIVLNNRKLFSEARTLLTQSLELQPDSVDAAAALAEAEAGVGNLDEASKHAERALKRAPDHATANLVLGMIFMERRNYPEARDTLLKAAAADPASPKSAYQLSLVFARLGDEERSRQYVEIYRERVRAFEEKLKVLRSNPR